MIIRGSRTKTVEIGQGRFRCPRCEADRSYRHMRQKIYLTMCSLPMFSTGQGAEWWECENCTRAYEPRAEPAPRAPRETHSF